MLTLQDFISTVEEKMMYVTVEENGTENGKEIKVYYEDYEFSTFHNYKIIITNTGITLYIHIDQIEKPQYIKEVISLQEAYDIMKKHDDLMNKRDELMWEMKKCGFSWGLI